jgi:mono/diheme cytochrome c family protein
VCTAIVGVSLINSLPRLRMNWRRQLAAALGLLAAAMAGTYVLAVVVPGGLAVTAAGRGAAVAATAVPAVEAFGMKSRAAADLASMPSGPAGGGSPFLQYCAACHGPDGRGLPGLGVNLRESEFVRRASAVQLKDFLRSGRDGSSPASRTGRSMPSFAWLREEALEQVVMAVQEPAR